MWPVCAVAAATGFILGAVAAPAWQDAVEPAQVLAGLVTYDPSSPLYKYSMGAWTLWHQLVALALRAGVTDVAASVGVSGALGALSLTALGAAVFVPSQDRRLSVVTALLISWAGATHPAALMGVVATYGVTGASWTLLSTALLGCGRTRTAGFMLGLSPAIHAAWGTFTLLAVAVTFVWSAPRSDVRSAPFIRAGLAGLLVAMASGGLQIWLTGRWTGWPSQHLPDTYTALVQLWDTHRAVVDWVSYQVASAAIAGGLALLWLGRRTTDPVRGWLRVLVILLVMGVLLSQAYVWAQWSPWWLLSLMPSRLLLLGALTCTALVVGLSAQADATDARRHVLVTAVLAALIVMGLVYPWVELGPRVAYLQASGAAWLIWCVMTPTRATTVTRVHRGVRSAVVIAASATVCLWLTVSLWTMGATHREAFEVDHALVTARHRPGVLLTAGGLHQAQLMTRRPVLLDGGALDELAYVPDALPMVVHILDRVYGVNFHAPPGVLAEERRGALDAETGRDVWQERTAVEWLQVAAEFGVTDVITPIGWRLQLRPVATGAHYVLWAITP
jgi:hypothetical protein